MVKAYLRYEHTKKFGILCEPDVNIAYSANNNTSNNTRFIFAAAAETINVINERTGKIIREIWAPKTYNSLDGTAEKVVRVTSLAQAIDGKKFAAGFSDGSVRVWNDCLRAILRDDSGKRRGEGAFDDDGDDFEDDDDDERKMEEYCESDIVFRGHKTAVSALLWTDDCTSLVSGGKDTDVVVWDVLEERGMFRLKGHRGQITSMVFVKHGNNDDNKALLLASAKTKKNKKKVENDDDDVNYYDDKKDKNNLQSIKPETETNFTNTALVTTSKDGFAKVWDLVGQRCCQTISGFGGECWASAYSQFVNVGNYDNNNNNKDSHGIVAIAGNEREIKFYSVFKGVEEGSILRNSNENLLNDGVEDAERIAKDNILDKALRLRFIGSFAKEARSRTISLQFSSLGTALGIQSVGKSIEIYDVKNAEEIEKKRKRRFKRRREKENAKKMKKSTNNNNQKSNDDDEDDDDDEEENDDEDDLNRFNAKDAFELSSIVRPTGKSIAPFAFQPETMDSHLDKQISLAISLDSNAVELYDIANISTKMKEDKREPKKRSIARSSGHRADVRVIALSPDESFLLSVSHSGAKVWDADTGKCARTIESGYGTCAFFAPDGRNAVVGTKEGGLEIIDCLAGTNSASAANSKLKEDNNNNDDDENGEEENGDQHLSQLDPLKIAHEGPVWGICALPDESGFVTCSGDKTIKFWEWTLVAANKRDKKGMKKLTATHSKTLQMSDDVLSVSITPDGKLLTASLLDNTLKVFFADTLKFSLSLYGHRLPALCHDVSSDSVLLASAGQDKNIRVWGLDFGDCHRSIHAHDDSVMALKFVNKTHYAFTCGKDKRVRYWDLDKYEMLLSLDEHHMAVWTIAISTTGSFVISAGADRSLRLYERTKEPFFLDEEKEKRLDSMFEDNAGIEMDEEDRKNSERLFDKDGNNIVGEQNGNNESGLAGRRTMETLDSADKIAAAVDLAKHELERRALYENDKLQSVDPSKVPQLKPNPLLLNMEPRQYALYQVAQVRPAELERAILCLPFLYCRLLLDYLKYWLERNEKVELCCTMTNLIIRLHFQQLGATREARATLDALKPLIRSRTKERLDDLGFNIAGLDVIERSAIAKAEIQNTIAR